MRTLDDFELAEVLWDAADPCLTDEDRSALSFALHTADPFLAIFAVVRMVIREDHGLPYNVFREFQCWLEEQPPLDADDPLMAMRLELLVIASTVRFTPATQTPLGGYGPETQCYFILDEAGVADAPRPRQAAALRHWLASHRPSPALRADLRESGFAGLLDYDGRES